MKIIGIGGKSTTGKTTLTSLISSYDDDIAEIHLDYILDDLKRKIAKPEKISTVLNGDDGILNLDNNPFNKVNSPLIHNSCLFFRRIFVSGILRNKILNLEKEGYSSVIIEGVTLNGLFINWDYLVQVDSSMEDRVERRFERDRLKCMSDQISEWDSSDERINGYRTLHYDRTVENSGDLIALDKNAKDIFTEILTFDSKGKKPLTILPFKNN